jgi:uncharacterized protein (DUF1778 family)
MVDQEERKTRTVTVKCSETERRLIIYVAELVGETPSGFTREAATTRAVEAIASRFDRTGN